MLISAPKIKRDHREIIHRMEEESRKRIEQYNSELEERIGDISVDQFIYNVEIICEDELNIINIEEWIEKNTSNHCMIKQSHLSQEIYNVKFISKDDATRFKLTWI